MTVSKSRLFLIIGGAGSGKSEYAEKLAVSLSETSGVPRIYLATMLPGGKEAEERIRRHRENRAGRGFRTVERGRDLDVWEKSAIRDAVVLLEDLGNLLGNEMFRENLYADGQSGEKKADAAGEAVLRGIRYILRQSHALIVVTNEIFSDGADYIGDVQDYRKKLGELNCLLAAEAEEVTEVICGIPRIR